MRKISAASRAGHANGLQRKAAKVQSRKGESGDSPDTFQPQLLTAGEH